MDPPEWAVVAALSVFFGVSVCLDVGHRVAQSKAHRDSEESGASVEAAVFGLLGLLLGFSFAGASSRLDTRRELIVNEANAIGTAYLRFDLLSAEPKAEMRKMLREYLDHRLRVYRDLPDIPAAERDNGIAMEMQQRIWDLAVRSTPPESKEAGARLMLLPALNEVFDIASSRMAILYVHIPGLILGLLVGVSWLGGLLAGYGMSKRGRRSWLHATTFALALAATVYVVVDLDHPRSGLIRVDSSDDALTQLRQTL